MSKARMAVAQDKFEMEKSISGGITVLTLNGTVGERFEGRKIAEALRTKKVVLNMRGVSRFASWGMSEWMDFLRINAERDLYLVECSTYAMSQINLVTGLLGHSKLVSFYASSRCAHCGEERESLLLIPRDREAIRTLATHKQECPACGHRMHMEDYPAAFFETIAERPGFDIDDEVLALLRSELRYDLAPDLTRFRAHRRVQKDYTYLRFSGRLATLPAALLADASQGTAIVDLKSIAFDPAEVAQWRSYVAAAMPKVSSLQLVNCPPGFLETGVLPEDFRDKLKVRTFAVSYDCVICTKSIIGMIDVAENLEQIVKGVVPSVRCSVCKSALDATLTGQLVARMRSLPARNRDAALDAFLTVAQAEPAEKLENCLIARPEKPKPTGRSRSAMFAVAGLATLLVGGLAVVGVGLWKQRSEPPPPVIVAPLPVVVPKAKPAFTRPEWIISDVPSSAYCQDLINRLMCVGVSSYRASRDDGMGEATDAALEELVSAVGLKVTDPFFRANVIPAYSSVRAKALSALQIAELHGEGAAAVAYAAANDLVRKARKHVVEILQVTGGAAVPAQRSDWYWEEYAGQDGKPNEVLVFVRYDVSLDAVRALVEKYSTTTSVMGTSSALTAFPALAWHYPDFTGGAVLTKIGPPLVRSAIKAGEIVVAVGDHRVSDANGFAQSLEEAKAKDAGAVKLTVRAGDGPARVIDVGRQ